MIRTSSSKKLTIAEFDWPFDTALDKNNRWVKLSNCIPWDELAESYCQGLPAERGRPAKDAHLVMGAVIIKHKLCLSDVETVQQKRAVLFSGTDGRCRAVLLSSANFLTMNLWIVIFLNRFVGARGCGQLIRRDMPNLGVIPHVKCVLLNVLGNCKCFLSKATGLALTTTHPYEFE